MKTANLVRVTLTSVTFVGNTPIFTGTDQAGRRRTFTSPVNYSVRQAQSLLNRTIQVAS